MSAPDRTRSAPARAVLTIRSALREGQRRLLAEQVSSASLSTELILMSVLECDRTYLYTHAEAELSAAKMSRFLSLIGERAAGKPTQYITGHQEFWGLDFEVSPDVLIPRPETEHLIEAVIELAAKHSSNKDLPLRVVDVGTGSGCIAVALASEFPAAEIFATDISPAALRMASRNSSRHGFATRVRFLETDMLAYFLRPEYESTFDFVVSNPPYVARAELDQLQREVRDYEPRLALGGLERGDEAYRQLFAQACRLLKPGGAVIAEIGYNKREEVLSLLNSGWTEIEVRPDLAGIPRVVSAVKSSSSATA